MVKYWFYSQGFRDTSLTVWDASTILHNYEVRTGAVISKEELDSGALADKLVDSDYDLTASVSKHLLFYLNYPPAEASGTTIS